MTDALTNLQKLPETAYVDNDYVDEDGKKLCRRFSSTAAPLIGIKRGEPGFYPIYSTLSAEQANQDRGVSPAQREAMLHGSMFGWHTKAADSDYYDDNGDPRRQSCDDAEAVNGPRP